MHWLRTTIFLGILIFTESQGKLKSLFDLGSAKASKLSKFNELEPSIACNKMRKKFDVVPEPSIACNKMRKKFDVVPGVSWGTLPSELQKRWSELKCDSRGEAKSTDSHTKQPASEPEPHVSINKELSSNGSEDEKWCWTNRQKYKVQPMKSWGNLPETYIPLWKSHHCDAIFTQARLNKKPIVNCTLQASDNSLPLIAIMAATTTRKMRKPSTKTLALFLYLLPSLVRTVDCGFRYEYVLGYDEGDQFYDTTSGLQEVKSWFDMYVVKPLKENGIQMTLTLVKVKNTQKKPGPVFIEMARKAYENGATYFYRVNDDTEFLNNWPSIYVKVLSSLTLPYGVIGPLCNHGNERILTHDFVHRLHMEIFEMNYYPPELSDWWMDDWISYVYGQQRTFMSKSIKVIHHTGHQGTRYQVDGSHEKLLPKLIEEGRIKLRNYLLKTLPTAVSDEEGKKILTAFDRDRYKQGFPHRDLPQIALS